MCVGIEVGCGRRGCIAAPARRGVTLRRYHHLVLRRLRWWRHSCRLCGLPRHGPSPSALHVVLVVIVVVVAVVRIRSSASSSLRGIVLLRHGRCCCFSKTINAQSTKKETHEKENASCKQMPFFFECSVLRNRKDSSSFSLRPFLERSVFQVVNE